jgi:GNAT superfamily N-acetyltransferase
LILRLATVEDLSDLYMMLLVMHSGTIAGTSPVNSEKLTATISNALHRGIVLVAEVDGKIVGSIGGMETSDWWSDKLYLADLWFFVYKEHRKSRAAIKLVRSFLEIGRDAKVAVKLGHVYSGDIDRKDNFYERLGMSKVGSLYMEA